MTEHYFAVRRALQELGFEAAVADSILIGDKAVSIEEIAAYGLPSMLARVIDPEKLMADPDADEDDWEDDAFDDDDDTIEFEAEFEFDDDDDDDDEDDEEDDEEDDGEIDWDAMNQSGLSIRAVDADSLRNIVDNLKEGVLILWVPPDGESAALNSVEDGFADALWHLLQKFRPPAADPNKIPPHSGEWPNSNHPEMN